MVLSELIPAGENAKLNFTSRVFSGEYLLFYKVDLRKKNKKKSIKNFKCLKSLNKDFQKEIFLKLSFPTNFCNDLSENFATKFSKEIVTIFE